VPPDDMRVPVKSIEAPEWGIRFNRDAALYPVLTLQTAPLPDRVRIPLQQHIGSEARSLVKEGDRVLSGQPIGRIGANRLGAHVHASVSGHVSRVGSAPAPGRRSGIAVDIEADGLDERWAGFNPHPRPLSLSTSGLRKAVIEGGVVGLGGATFPAGIKLNRGSGVETLILNGAECEPVIRCDDALIRHDTDGMLLGAQIMLRILEADSCVIALKEDMHAAIKNVNAALTELADDRFQIALVPSIYPVGGEAQLIQLITGREIPSGGLPWDSGAICQNVATAAAVATLLTKGEPLLSRIVTVTGAGIASPGNFTTRIGTSIEMLINAAGGYTPESAGKLVMGGPMMGITLDSDQLPVTKATNCIYVPGKKELAQKAEPVACIRCGDCATACPVSLMPQLLLQAHATSDFDRLQQLGLPDCIECGCCDYVCPSRIPLTQQFVSAKQQLWEIAFEKRRAKKASERIAARDSRKQRAAVELESTLEQQTRSVKTTADAQSELDALLKRTGANDADDAS